MRPPALAPTPTLRVDGLRDQVIEKTWNAAGTSFSTTKIAWTYDADDRLIAETRDEGNDGAQNGSDYTAGYSFDLAGNRISYAVDKVGTAADETINSTYNARDELIQEVSTLSGTTDFAYDANGSLTTESVNGTPTQTYTWDLRNRMATATVNGVTTTYGYNSGGFRVAETTGTSARTFLPDGMNPTGNVAALEERVNNALDRSYLLGQRVEAQKDSQGVAYLLRDGHGSTRQLSTDTGGIIADANGNPLLYSYDAYGSNIGFTASTARTTQLFGGDGEYDVPTGLTYHDARFRQGYRFISMDSYGGQTSDPMSLHKYLYANGNPVNGWDPTGHEFELGGLLGVAIAGLQLDFGAALTPFSIGRKFGLVHESTPSIFGSQVDSFFNTVSENLAVFGGFAQGFVEGAAQGFFNVVNGIQDAIIGTANLAIKAELATLGPVGLEFNPSIPSPDWSYGLIYNEPATQHSVSKFLGGIGASLASSGGFGMLGAVGEGGEAGLAAEELSLTQTVAKNAATRPYVNSRLVAQEIMNAKPPIPDPGGIPGGLRWDVEGAFNGSKGVYQLVVNPSTKQIVHFLFKSS